MTSLTHIAAVVVAGLLASGPAQQQPSPTAPQQAASTTGVVSFIGCVERVPAGPSAPGTTPPAYKLIDIQPGAGTRMPVKPDTQVILTPAKSLATPIELGKFVNQWVEVSGTLAPAPTVTATSQAKPGATATGPLSTLMMTSLKVVATECK